MATASTPTPNQLLFLVGGARSGKSRLAQSLAGRAAEARSAPVTYLATATAGDDDMAERIRRHQLDRPAHWGLVEEPLALDEAVAGIPGDVVLIVDCLTVWAANRLLADHPAEAVEAEAAAVAHRLAARAAPSIVVSNEVGLGVHPPTELGRRYQDLLGRVNQLVAAEAGRALLLVAGRALDLADPGRLLAGWPEGG